MELVEVDVFLEPVEANVFLGLAEVYTGLIVVKSTTEKNVMAVKDTAEKYLVAMEIMVERGTEVTLKILVCHTLEVTRAIYNVIIARSMVICKLHDGRNKMKKSMQALWNKKMSSADYSWHMKVEMCLKNMVFRQWLF